MKTILKLGGYHFLLAGKPNHSAIALALGSAVLVRPTYRDGGPYYAPTDPEQHPDIEFHLIADTQFRPEPKPKRKANPSVEATVRESTAMESSGFLKP